MPKPKSKAFAASKSEQPPPKGGRTVPADEFIKTTIILHRQEGGGGAAKDVARIYDFLSANHLAVIEGSTRERTATTRLIDVGATLGDYRAAGVDPGVMKWVKQGSNTHRVRRGSIKFPDSLHGAIMSWTGFDTQPNARAHSRFARAPRKGTASPAAAQNKSFSVPKLAKLYGFPTDKLKGKGQSIAIIELNDFDSVTHQPTGTGFTAADLNAYFKSIKIPTPNVVPVGVIGGGNVPGPDPNADGEVALDIEVAGAVAPEATIVVYFAPNTDRGFVRAIHEAIFDPTHKPSVISISWGGPEDFSKKQYRDAMNAAFQDAADNDVTILVASGDNGSSDLQQSDGKPHVDFPSSLPLAISCGGLRTQATTAGPVEAIWNNGAQGGGGGGGVSNFFAKPTYQAGATVPKSPKGFAGKGVPDVSGTADPQTGYQVFVGGQPAVIGGTSAVAPLYAGLFALINQSRAAKGKKPAGACHATLYGSPASFRDITQGGNDINGNLGGKYKAGTGWDPCSGLGSPRGDALLTLLG